MGIERKNKPLDFYYDVLSAFKPTYQNGSDDAYDDNGILTEITRGATSVTYEYNGANELIRENNGFTNIHSTNGAMHEHGLFLYVNKAEQVDMI